MEHRRRRLRDRAVTGGKHPHAVCRLTYTLRGCARHMTGIWAKASGSWPIFMAYHRGVRIPGEGPYHASIPQRLFRGRRARSARRAPAHQRRADARLRHRRALRARRRTHSRGMRTAGCVRALHPRGHRGKRRVHLRFHRRFRGAHPRGGRSSHNTRDGRHRGVRQANLGNERPLWRAHSFRSRARVPRARRRRLPRHTPGHAVLFQHL